MDRVDQLEKRVQELECFIRLMKMKNEDAGQSALNWKKITLDQKGFEDHFIKKYSKSEYRSQGFDDSFDKLDFQDAIVRASECNNRVRKLKFWWDFQRDMKDTIGLADYLASDYWTKLRWFVQQAIQHYQNDVIGYILDKGTHMDEGGRKEEINREEVTRLWEKYSKTFNYIHSSGRYKGEPKREEIYKKIANDITEPAAIRTIRNHISNLK